MNLLEDLNSMLRNPEQMRSVGRDLAAGTRGQQSQRASKEQYQAQGKRVKAEIFKLLKMANEAGVMPRGKESETFDILVKELKSSMFGSR